MTPGPAPGRGGGIVAPVRRSAVCGALLLLALAGCGGGGDEPAGPDPTELEGAWDISLVVGSVDTAPGGDALGFPADATYRERWVFDGCDEAGCTLRRPDGGFLLGDLDHLQVGVGAGLGLDEDDGLRLVGIGEGTSPPPVEADDATACDGAATERWAVRVEVSVTDGVISGSAFRTPEVLQAQVGAVTCFGHDLTLGLSGTPAR